VSRNVATFASQGAALCSAYPEEIEIRYVPLDKFLPMLAQGWRFPRGVAQPITGGAHGYWSCIMERVI
jgi:hypothetical protein